MKRSGHWIRCWLIFLAVLAYLDKDIVGVVAYYCDCDYVFDEGLNCFDYDTFPGEVYNCQTRACGNTFFCSTGGLFYCSDAAYINKPTYQLTAIPPYPSTRRGCTKVLNSFSKLRQVPRRSIVVKTLELLIADTCSNRCYTSLVGSYGCSEQAMYQMLTEPIPLKTSFSSPFNVIWTPPLQNTFQCNADTLFTPIVNGISLQVTSNSAFACTGRSLTISLIPLNVQYKLYTPLNKQNVCLRSGKANAWNFCACQFVPSRRRRSAFEMIHDNGYHTENRIAVAMPHDDLYEYALGKVVDNKLRLSVLNSTTDHLAVRYSGLCETVNARGTKASQTCCQIQGDSDQWACLPSMLLIGAQKSGTTALFGHLLEHPEFRPAKPLSSVGIDKEVHFFDTDHEWNAGPHQYLSHFRTVSKAERSYFINADFSPSYMVKYSTLESIRELLPLARIVVMLRDPVKRVWSELKMKIRQDVLNFEWRQLVSRHAFGIKACMEKAQGFSQMEDVKNSINKCVPAVLSRHERWSRFFYSVIYNAVLEAGFVEQGSARLVNIARAVQGVFHVSDNGTVSIPGFGLHPQGVALTNYDSDFMNEDLVYQKLVAEIGEITKCQEQSDESLKACFQNERWRSSDISRGHILRSMYFAQLSNIYELFAKDQVLIIETEELRDSPQQVLRKVCRHVGLSDFRFARADSETLEERIQQEMPEFASLSGWTMNKDAGHTSDHMPENLRALLIKFFAPHNEKLFQLLDVKYEHWIS